MTPKKTPRIVVEIEKKISRQPIIAGRFHSLLEAFTPREMDWDSFPTTELDHSTVNFEKILQESPNFLRGIPLIPNLNKKILRILMKKQGKLQMDLWHGEDGACGTTHCQAGWAIYLGGKEGAALEARFSPYIAGLLIYWVNEGYIPNFFTTKDRAMRDIRAHASAPKPSTATSTKRTTP